ncbi:MAG: aspartate aminotransferase family protein [PS1 clade bacterium]|uniref:Acetylornithine aminotransferase n=1 Tax=PS1 clade bacterium TaxID=2175152 RepID=A0A937L3I9_9PROT|nr:aspartate aminotransferase family protein [PS1 clade bacterium]
MSEQKSHIMPTYNRADLRFVRGEGAWLETETGEKYLDFGSGVAVNTLGHAHPKLVAALGAQSEKLWHVSNLYQIPEQEKLADMLCANSFADLVFFGNSGAEAAEGMIKVMRKYHAENAAPERVTLISFKGAFHGRTLAALAAAGNPDYLEGFGPAPQGFVQCQELDVEAVEAMIDETTAGILIEPVQGEGGVRDVGTAFLRALRELCDKHGILLGFDEVQCGIGRTGKLFAHEYAAVEPDVMAIAKGIGGGFPLGAVLTTETVGRVLQPGTHGSTYGGNPLACAVGAAVLDEVLSDGFLDRVQQTATYFRQHLARLLDENSDIFEDLRGSGLMVGLKCKPANSDVVAALRDEKVLTIGAGENVLRIVPPLNVTQAEVDIAVAAIETACTKLRGSTA